MVFTLEVLQLSYYFHIFFSTSDANFLNVCGIAEFLLMSLWTLTLLISLPPLFG